ncbi:hutG, partial [Symbiodinium microadriaticum]
YKYFPNRNRKQTAVYSWLALIGFTAFGYLLAEVIDRHNESKEEMWKEYARTHMTFTQATVNKNQQDAFRDIMMKARRKRLGLPAEAPGSVEINDPFDD